MSQNHILTAVLTVLLVGGLMAVAAPAAAQGSDVADEPVDADTESITTQQSQSGNVTLELDPTSATVGSGERAILDVIVNHTGGDNNGISSYDEINISVTDSSVATIVGYNLTSPENGDQSQVLNGGELLNLGAATFNEFSTAEPSYTIANVTVEGASGSGSTDLAFDPAAGNTVVDFDGNFTYTVDGFQSATIDDGSGSQGPAASLSELQIAGQGSSASIIWGDQGDIAVDLSNVGDADGSFDLTLTVEDSNANELINQTTSQSVSQGQTQTVSFLDATGGLSPDTYSVSLSADGDIIRGTLTVEEGSVDSVALTPASDQTVTAGGNVDFEAKAFNVNGNLLESTDDAFNWSAEGGAIDNTTGEFTETTAGSYTASATLEGISNTTVVTVEPAAVSTVELSPSVDRTIQSGGTVEFGATALDQFGNVNESTDSTFAWDAEGGSIGSAGLFDETTLGIYNVTAALDGTTSAPTQVTVESGNIDRVELDPATDQTIQSGESIAFNATAFDSSDTVLDDTDSNFTWSAEGGEINTSGFFNETTAGSYNVTADLNGIKSASTTVTVQAPGQPEIGSSVTVEVGGSTVSSILTGTAGNVLVDVTNVGGSAASFELSLSFEAQDGSTVGGFDTVNTSELASGASETVTFTGVTGDLTAVGIYDIVVSTVGASEQVTDTRALSASVDVDGNGQPAADAANGPTKFDGLFDSVSGQSNDNLGIVDVVALFNNFGSNTVDDNAEFFRFNAPDDPDPTTVGIADVVALFREV
jgi:hypothetical protein